MVGDIQNLSNLAPHVAIVGIFLWYMEKKDKQMIERDAQRDQRYIEASTKQEQRFIEAAKKKDEHHAVALESFTGVINKVSEYFPKVTDALEKYNDYFPLIYQHNVEMSKRLKKRGEKS